MAEQELYKAEGKKMNWVEQGVGMLVWWSSKFGDEQRFRCLRVSDMHPILDEELYDNFDENYTCTKTKRGTPSGMSRPARPPKPSFVPVNLQPT